MEVMIHDRPRIAVITPYCSEETAKIWRCHESVLAQAEICTHFLVADGPSNREVEQWDCRHISLGKSHKDNGNTPRGLGGIAAMNEGYDIVMYLDADNWYDPYHASSILYTQLATQCDVAFASRFVVLLDGSVVDEEDPEDLLKAHVDTSCMAIFSSAFRALSHWCLMPQSLGPMCDRVMFSLLMSEFKCAWTEYRSVFFESYYAGHFKLAGLEAPADAKGLKPVSIDVAHQVNSEYLLRAYKVVELASS